MSAPPVVARTRISFTVNGRRHTVETHAMKRLLDVLREECGLTGTKEGCGEGECGACTVLMNGVSVNSCLVPAIQAEGAGLVTVEGLARGKALSALQSAFVDMGGAQCGICTPGMLLSAHELIERSAGRVPGDQEVRDALAGNLCRCTGYQKIVDAVRAAARAASAAKRRAPKRRAPGRGAPERKDAPGPKRAPRRKRAPGRKKKAAPKKAATRKKGSARARKATGARGARRVQARRHR